MEFLSDQRRITVRTERKSYWMFMRAFCLVSQTTNCYYWQWQRIFFLFVLIIFSTALTLPAIAANNIAYEGIPGYDMAADNWDQADVKIEQNDFTAFFSRQDSLNESTRAEEENAEHSYGMTDIDSVVEQFRNIIEYFYTKNILNELSEIFVKCNSTMMADPNFQELMKGFDDNIYKFKMDGEEFRPLIASVIENVAGSGELSEKIEKVLTKIRTFLNEHPIDVNRIVVNNQDKPLAKEGLGLTAMAMGVGKDAETLRKQQSFFTNSTKEYLQHRYPALLGDQRLSHWLGFPHQLLYTFLYKYLEANTKETDSSNPYIRTLGIESLIAAGVVAYKYDEDYLNPKNSQRDNKLISIVGNSVVAGLFAEKDVYKRHFFAKLQGEIIKHVLLIFLTRTVLNNPLGPTADDSIDIDRFVRELVANLYETWILEKWTTCDIFARVVMSGISSLNCTSGSSDMKKLKFLVTMAPNIGSMCNAGCKWAKHKVGKVAQKNIPQFAKDKHNYWCTSELKANGASVAVCSDNTQDGQVVRRINMNERWQLLRWVLPDNYYNKINSLLLQGAPEFYGKWLGNGPNNYGINKLGLKGDVLRLFSWVPTKLQMKALSKVNDPLCLLVDKIFDKTYNFFSPFFVAQEEELKTIAVTGNDNAFILANVSISDSCDATLTLNSLIDKQIKITKIKPLVSVNGDSEHLVASPLPIVFEGKKDAQVMFKIQGVAKGVPYAFSTEYIVGDEVSGKYLHGMIWFMIRNDDVKEVAMGTPPRRQELYGIHQIIDDAGQLWGQNKMRRNQLRERVMRHNGVQGNFDSNPKDQLDASFYNPQELPTKMIDARWLSFPEKGLYESFGLRGLFALLTLESATKVVSPR